MVCKICKSKKYNDILNIKYRYFDYIDQNVFLCSHCGFVWSDYYEKDSRHTYDDKKSVYLAELIRDFMLEFSPNLLGEFLEFDFFHASKQPFEKDAINANGEVKVELIADYLEHLSESELDTFSKTIGEKKPDYLIVEAPIIDKWNAESISIYGKFISSHCNYFSENTINFFIQSLGYKLENNVIIENTKYSVPPIFPCSISLWRIGGVTTRFEKEIDKNSVVTEYINQCDEKLKRIEGKIRQINNDTKLSVWGCSNYAAKLLGMTSLNDKNIVTIWDNSPEKVGKVYNGIEVQCFSMESWVNKGKPYIIIASNTAYKEIYMQIINKGLDKDCIMKIW